jgi:hypothetical protein
MKRRTIFHPLPLFAVLALCYTTFAHADVIWPALLMGLAIRSSLFLILISLIIEGLVLHRYIKNISYSRAMLISSVGNLFSAIIGTIVMVFVLLFWELLLGLILTPVRDSQGLFIKNIFPVANLIVTYTLMYLGSAFIELIAIKKIFHYTSKELLAPVFIGNLISYLLIAAYQLFYLGHFSDFFIS